MLLLRKDFLKSVLEEARGNKAKEMALRYRDESFIRFCFVIYVFQFRVLWLFCFLLVFFFNILFLFCVFVLRVFFFVFPFWHSAVCFCFLLAFFCFRAWVSVLACVFLF